MFEDISKIPYEKVNGKSVLHRLIVGLGYRFHRCSLKLDEVDNDFRPGEGTMSKAQLLAHIADLILHSLEKLGGHTEVNDKHDPAEILGYIDALQATVLMLDTEELDSDFFYLINGPISDAISHIGQLNTYKRLAGISSPNSKYYKGLPQ